MTNFITANFKSDPHMNLEQLLPLVAGVYQDPRRRIGLEKTVFLTGCNYAYINFLHNFKCFTDRLGIKFLVISMDHMTHHHIVNHTTMLSYSFSGGKIGFVSGEATEFRQKQFNLITAKKKEIVYDVMSLGYDVIFADADIVIIRDPIPILLWKNVDYVHSVNAICTREEYWDFKKSGEEGNTGFYFVRSNPRTLKLWKEVYESAPKFAHLDDQAIFWKIIRSVKDPIIHPLKKCCDYLERNDDNVLVTCPLDTCMFSSGMLSRIYIPEYTYEQLIENLAYRNSSIFTVHPNYIKGNHMKMKKLEEHGMWLAVKNHSATSAGIGSHWTENCKPYHPFEVNKPTQLIPSKESEIKQSDASLDVGTANTRPDGPSESKLITMNDHLLAVAGVYANKTLVPPLLREFDLSRLVLMTACNFGFVNHLQNFNCFAKRLGFKFLVIAMDLQTHEYVSNHTDMISFPMFEGRVGSVSGEMQDFRSKQFNLITAKKKEAVHDALELGYDVLFSDTDVALLQDPLPHMIFKGVDYVHSLNAICLKETYPWTFRKSKEEGNTGFYLVRSNKRTLKLWKDAYEAAPKFPNLDDQAIFWRIIRVSNDPPIDHIGACRHYNATLVERDNTKHLSACVLDTCKFSSGMLSRAWVPEFTYEELVANNRFRNSTMITVHANYIKGNAPKMKKLEEHGLWLATKDGSNKNGITHWTGACKPYNVNMTMQ